MNLILTFVGALISALVGFFSTQAGSILIGLGISFSVAKGLETIIGFIIQDVQAVSSFISTAGGVHAGLAQMMVQFAALCGLFDAINILLGGVVAKAGMLSARVFLRRLTG